MRPSNEHSEDTTAVSEVFNETTVLFVTSSEEIQSKLPKALPKVSTTFAPTTEEAYDVFDESTAVVCLFDTLLTKEFETFRTDVLVRHPFCQFIVVESQPLVHDVDDYDQVLQAPVSPQQFRKTIRQRILYAAYSELLQEYYQLNLRIGAYARLHHTEPPTPEHISKRLQQLRSQLEGLRAELTEPQLQEIANTVAQHKQYVNRPSDKSKASSQSKYHPDSCPDCGVAWGTNHENELGRGFEVIGAGVWKCTHCGEVIHDLHDSNQSITKW